ncbi:MAG: Omp28 family outer membrane lipoprotein [Muribaculaceae bacterium]|nr:Omp28 family outer membrane lipoprotein [Muribaculaceae bacterium]
MKIRISYITKHLGVALGISCALAGLTSCDYVSSDDRYIKGPEITAERAVLLEDFTGQNCLNCPDAHEVIELLQEQFGSDNLVAVSIHCGSFGISTKRTNFSTGSIGLMTDEGNAILEAYGITSFPMGVINFGKPTTYDLWTTAVRNAIKMPTDVQIGLSTSFQEEYDEQTGGKSGTITATADILSGSTRIANVQFWVVEDGIIAQQKLSDGQINKQYVHNNVFRGQMLPGLKGKQISLTEAFVNSVTASIPIRWTDKERWNTSMIYVVCIVSDETGVIQVKRADLIDRSLIN